MAVDVKFCGLTRSDDAAAAAGLGAAYVGVILTSSPRRVGPRDVVAILAPAKGVAMTVGVFGPAPDEEIVGMAYAAGVDVVQLHADPDAAQVERMRGMFDGQVWAAVRIAGRALPVQAEGLLRAADAVVLDAKVTGKLGGTGTAFDWDAIARQLDSRPAAARVVLAGGLNEYNVAAAIRAVAPDVVDVSSGVERAAGIKDHARMRAFTDAVRGAAV